MAKHIISVFNFWPGANQFSPFERNRYTFSSIKFQIINHAYAIIITKKAQKKVEYNGLNE
jgi:hypothetical protein